MFRIATAITLALALASCVSLEPEPIPSSFTVRSSAASAFTPTARHAVVVTDFSQKALPDSAQLIVMTRRMLEAAGFPVVRDGERVTASDVKVSVAYDVSAPEFSSYTTRKPIYGERGVASKRTVTRTNKHGDKVSETTYTPRTEIVRYEEEVNPLILFTHTLSLEAHKGSATTPLWTVKVSRKGSTGDREYAAFMLRAAQPYIGKGGDAVEVRVAEGDPGLIFIRAGQPETKHESVAAASK